MKKISLILSLLASLQTAHAANLITDSNGTLQGANGIAVNGQYYNVTFTDGLLWDQNPQKSPLFLQNMSNLDADNALLASQALIDQVFTKNTDYNQLLKPIAGCSSASVCQIITPFAYDASINKISYAYTNNYSGLRQDQTGNSFILGNGSFDTSNYPTYTLAIWKAATPVPEPSNMSLLLLGVVLLSFYRKNPIQSAS